MRAAKIRAAPFHAKMVVRKKLGSAKRFGARYGRTLKERFAVVEKEQRKRHKCPYCNAIQVRRIAVGIWHCKKCDAKFAGKAYSVREKIAAKEEAEAEKGEAVA